MSDKGGFEENQARAQHHEGESTPFHDQLRPEAGDHNRSDLQHLSPDKKVYEVGNLASLTPQDRQQLDRSLNQAVEQWSKVVEPLRQVWNNWKRQEMSGVDNGSNGENWAKNYMAKVGEVLRDNMDHLSADIPFRIACPVQSFLPDKNGAMKAETLHAFFPPLLTEISDRYVVMPLHSADPIREASLRQSPSLANSISSDELVFRCKVNSLLPRRDRQELSA